MFNDHLVFEDKSSRTGTGANDHGLVRVHFDWNPMKQILAQPEG